jgi:hypothetical protein
MLFSLISYGQLKISLRVYKDSTRSAYLSNVKVSLIHNKKKNCFKRLSKGNYEIIIDKSKSNYSLEIKKRRYMTLVVDLDKTQKIDYTIEAILKKAYGSHDSEKYEGESMLLSIEKKLHQ